MVSRVPNHWGSRSFRASAGSGVYDEVIRRPAFRCGKSCRYARLFSRRRRRVPIENLRAGPVQDAFESPRVLVNGFQIFDSMRLSADVGMDGKGHDLGAVFTLGIEPIELVYGAPGKIFALMVLNDHHGDVVDLDRVGQGDQRAARGGDHGGLVVIDPIADVFYAGAGQELRCLQCLGQTRAQPAYRTLAAEAIEDVEGAVDHAGLVVDLMNRDLIVAVTHELPIEPLGLPGNTTVVLAGARVDGQCRRDAEPLVKLEETPGAHPHAVFVPAPVRHVGKQGHAGGRRKHLAWHRPCDIPDLVIDNGPEYEPGVLREPERWPVHDGREFTAISR